MFFIQQYIFEKKKKTHLQVAYHTRCAFFFIQTILKRGNEITTMSQ